MGHGDDHRIAGPGLDERMAAFIHLHIFRQGSSGPGAAFLAQIGHTAQLHVLRAVAEDQPAVLRAHVSQADHAQAQLVHHDLLHCVHICASYFAATLGISFLFRAGWTQKIRNVH